MFPAVRNLVLSVLTLATALGAIPSGAEAADRRPMTVEDLWAMDRIGSPALSPDGKWVVFTVSDYDMETNKSNSDLWLVPADGSAEPRRLTWNEGSDSGPLWSPDGRAVLFTSKRGDGPSQLHLLPMAGGEAEPLTELPFTPQAPKWFPDGKRIVFLGSTWPDIDDDFEALKKRLDERKDDKVDAKISESRLVRYWDHYLTDGSVQHFFVLDLETREVKDITPGWDRLLPFWGNGSTYDLSPDGFEIVFTANTTPAPYTLLNFDIFLMPSTGGDAVNITPDNPADDGGPRYSPDGRYIVYTRNDRPNTSPDFSRFARYDRRTRTTEGLAEDWDGQPGGWEFTPDGRTILFTAQERGYTNLFLVPTAGGPVRRAVHGGSIGNLQTGPGDRVVFTLQAFRSPPRLYTVKLGGGTLRAGGYAAFGSGDDAATIDSKLVPLTSFNQVILDSLDLGRVENAWITGADGDSVQMFVLYPPGFDRSRTWPLLMLVHGGPHSAWGDSFHFRWNAALFAAPGYVTVALNFHGSTGFGQEFAESILGNHGDKPFADVMAAVDRMLRTGFIDETRMAAGGGSYGGYLTSWILGHTDRFACLVNHAGVYDLMGQFASDGTWGRPNNYGAAPWEDPDRIDLYSPSRYAMNFNTPTLILHGEKDYRVPYTQGLNLHGVLQGKGVPSRLVVFPEENHWILKPRSARVWWGEVHDWLERYLGEDGAD